MRSKSLVKRKGEKIVDSSWDYRDEYTKLSNHGFHTYPAMMIPQIARRLIRTYGKTAKVLLDPFMGSGTALLESKLHPNFQLAYGIDINPLALLIAKVKTTPINTKMLWNEYHKLVKSCLHDKRLVDFRQKKLDTPNFFNINFWFKSQVIKDLTIIKNSIDAISFDDENLEKNIKDFFLIAFSETVRNVSNTRKREYKLYRMNEKILSKFNPNTFNEFKEISKTNIYRMEHFLQEHNPRCEIKILDEDTRFRTSIPSNEVDIIITSPPYGDSRTTVAYGQFSRLSLQWLGIDKHTVFKIDKMGLGGIPVKNLENNLDLPTLSNILSLISKRDPKRAEDVLSFYLDFDKCVQELDRVMKYGSFICFVVGNRTVKGIQIPTDEIIVELFQARNNYIHHNTFVRNIPHKRMPRRNSPNNIKGDLSPTINQENIIILEKQ